jgi:serine/threonine protein kinase
MKLPGEKQWERVEAIADQLAGLPRDEVGVRLGQLASQGEASTVISLLGEWLNLPPPPPPLGPGSVVGNYTLVEKLGEGGMGSVWRATQPVIGRDVALKLIHPGLVTATIKARFLEEIKLLGQLSHPGIVQIFDAGVHQGPDGHAVPYFTMELITGAPLKAWAAAHREDRARVLRLGTAICSALQSAHDRRIVHRDLKPANVLVKEDDQPVVLDFGIARLAGLAFEEAGCFAGTPQYAAPEQHLGRDQDFRSGESVDVYSMGAVLFEMLTGRRLFEFPPGTPISEMRRSVLNEPIPRLSDLLPNCPPIIDDVVARAVRRDPADRYYSIGALGRALARAGAAIDRPKAAAPAWVPAAGLPVPGTAWRLVNKLGEGGAGEVWLGTHASSGERKVFKFCDSEDKARTLKRELTLYRLLKERVGRNPHFIPLHDVSLDEAPWYLLMDYTEARDLEAWCEQAPGLTAMPVADRLEIVAQTAEALQAAHEAGILHRDIKPANILVHYNETSQIHVSIADFGIGQLITDELIRGNTHLGFTRTVEDLRQARLSGTILYLAPEIIEGGTATARSDIYSLGVVLWQLLAGNLRAALDPAGWPARISDPLLREDLSRCLAGDPEKRWASAGDLAAHLRALPERQAEASRRQAELSARERAAYHRGLLRATAVAAAVVLVIGASARIAWTQRRNAERARGEIALQQAASLGRADLNAGRKARGMELLETAAATTTNRAAMRTVAAAIFGLADIVKLRSPARPVADPGSASFSVVSNETCRAVSLSGALVARGRSGDGLNGVVDLVDGKTGGHRLTIERKVFPWMPVPEPGTFEFSPDERFLAVGGAETSRHILIFNVHDGALRCYLFQGVDPLAVAWHPGGRLMATGGADGAVRIWDIGEAVAHAANSARGNQFDLPPALDVPALDIPLTLLRGHRGPVRKLAFDPAGGWLASLDDAGYLRFHKGFDSPPTQDPAPGARLAASDLQATDSQLVVETRVERAEEISSLTMAAGRLTIGRGGGAAEQYQLMASELPAEVKVAPDVRQVAWNADGTGLCAVTLTDIHWLETAPLKLAFSSAGKNPAGVAPPNADGFWSIPNDNQFVEWRVAGRVGVGQLEKGKGYSLTEAVKGQGSLTALAAAGDGRIAIYRGRRIQFFARRQSAGQESSLVADGASGVFRDLIWDGPGRTLGVVFRAPEGTMRVETWKTSPEFPPKCQKLTAAVLECERVVPAQDGRCYLVRAKRSGLFRFDPEKGDRQMLEASAFARQDAPLAASPDGKILAMVIDRQTIRLLTLPDAGFYADLHSSRLPELVSLYWDPSGQKLASVTQDGYLQVWSLAPWRKWITAHRL